MKKVKIIVLAGLAVLFFAWMLFSTKLIAVSLNSVSPVVEPPVTKDFMGLSFPNRLMFSQSNTMFDTMQFSGMIYNISYATDEEATRSLILSSSDSCYRFQLDEIRRNAFYQYENIDKTRKYYVGFAFEFSPLDIDDGMYKILLQVEENGEPVTRLATGYVMEKINGHASLVYRPSEQVEPIVEPQIWANSGFNEFSLLADGTLNLTGWGVVDGVNSSEETEVFLEVFSGEESLGVYSTTKENITYIADYFDNPGYYGAGFRASIPNVPADNISVRVYVRHNGIYYKCSYHFVPDAEMQALVSVMDDV